MSGTSYFLRLTEEERDLLRDALVAYQNTLALLAGQTQSEAMVSVFYRRKAEAEVLTSKIRALKRERSLKEKSTVKSA